MYLHWEVSEKEKASTRPPERGKRNKIKHHGIFRFLTRKLGLLIDVHNQDCPYIHSIKRKQNYKNEMVGFCYADQVTMTVRDMAFKMPLGKSKMITAKTPHKKPYA